VVIGIRKGLPSKITIGTTVNQQASSGPVSMELCAKVGSASLKPPPSIFSLDCAVVVFGRLRKRRISYRGSYAYRGATDQSASPVGRQVYERLWRGVRTVMSAGEH